MSALWQSNQGRQACARDGGPKGEAEGPRIIRIRSDTVARADGADRSLLGLLLSQTSGGREKILYMDLQSACYQLNFGRVDGPSFCFSIFQVQNQFLNRSCGFVQNFAVVFMLCFGHPLMIPFWRTKTNYLG
jgi:hypothetical protein